MEVLEIEREFQTYNPASKKWVKCTIFKGKARNSLHMQNVPYEGIEVHEKAKPYLEFFDPDYKQAIESIDVHIDAPGLDNLEDKPAKVESESPLFKRLFKR